MGFYMGFIVGFFVVLVIWCLDGIGIRSPYQKGFHDGYETAMREVRKLLRRAAEEEDPAA